EPGDLDPRSMALNGAVVFEDTHLLPACGRIDSDGRARERDELAGRNLDLDRVDVVVLQRVPSRLGGEREQVERVERTQSGQAEDRAEGDEERIGTLAPAHPHPAPPRLPPPPPPP